MADLNALIAQGAQFRVPPPVDPMGNMAQLMQLRHMQDQSALMPAQLQHAQQQNALAQQQLNEYTRARTGDEAWRALFATPGANITSPEFMRNAYNVDPTKAQAYQKLMNEQQKSATEEAARRAKLMGDTTMMYREALSDVPDRATALQWLQRQVNDPAMAGSPVTKTPLMEAAARIPTDPAAFEDWKKRTALGMTKYVEQNAPKFFQQDTGSFLRTIGIPGLGGAFTEVPGSRVATTMTPGQIAANKIAQQQLGVSQEQLGVSQGQLAATQAAQRQALDLANRPVFSEAGQGFISRPTAAQPAGAFTPLPGVKASQDQRAALKALKTAGYDPATGEDNISKLISESTSGGLQAASAGALGFLFGSSTSGMKAISALAGTANQIALDLVGGKLGAGISNDDRNFIASALGDVANPYKTAEERLAGWTAAKDRMVESGMIPPPNKSKPGAPTRENAAGAAGAAPTVDQLVDFYLRKP